MSIRTPQVPGTHIYDTRMSREGRPLNKLLYSLKDAQGREAFTADEAARCDEFGLTAEQKAAVLDRDWRRMTEVGASVFYVVKLAALDRKSMQDLGGAFTGMTTEEFMAELQAGGRTFG